MILGVLGYWKGTILRSRDKSQFHFLLFRVNCLVLHTAIWQFNLLFTPGWVIRIRHDSSDDSQGFAWNTSVLGGTYDRFFDAQSPSKASRHRFNGWLTWIGWPSSQATNPVSTHWAILIGSWRNTSYSSWLRQGLSTKNNFCAGNRCRKGSSPEEDVVKASAFSELCGRLMLFVSLALSLVVAYEGVYLDIVGHTLKVLTWNISLVTCRFALNRSASSNPICWIEMNSWTQLCKSWVL